MKFLKLKKERVLFLLTILILTVIGLGISISIIDDESISTMSRNSFKEIYIEEYKGSKNIGKLELKIKEYNKLDFQYKSYEKESSQSIGSLDSIGDNIWAGYLNDTFYGINYCRIEINKAVDNIKITLEKLPSNCGSIEYFNREKNKIKEVKEYDKEERIIKVNNKDKLSINEFTVK